MMHMKIVSISNFFRKLKSQKGYVAILLAVFVPVVLYGTKLILDFMTLHESGINLHGAGTIYRNCANEAALEVAKNWNPGIGLSCQKRALLKVADRVYNNTVGVDNSTTLSKAIPGIQMMEQKSYKLGKGFDPITIKTGLATPKDKTGGISYETGSTVKRNVICSFSSNQWNWPFTTWMILDKLTSQNSENFVYDKFDEIVEPVQNDDDETPSDDDTTETKSEVEATVDDNQADENTGKYVLNHIDRYVCMHPEKIIPKGRYQDTDGGKILCTVVVDKKTLDVAESGFTSDFTSEFKNSGSNNADSTPGPEMNFSCEDTSSTTQGNNSGEVSSTSTVNSADVTTSGTEEEANGNNSSGEVETNGDGENSKYGKYTYRTNDSDQRVQLTVENDKIAVQIDNRTTGYAIPAECNVDIILTCPTNSTANEISNSEDTSVIDGDPTDNDVKNSQIYQIGQAFRTFAKQFYHIRGVTMGLIPYSGKISISPESSSKGWTCVEKKFAERNYLNQVNTFQPFLVPSVLYDSSGAEGASLEDDEFNFVWGTLLAGYPLRSRRDVLSTDPPSTDNSIKDTTGEISSQQNAEGTNLNKFFRQNSNPCYGGYASLLSMKCIKNCPEYLPNPYYIIEPTADIRKIYEMCGALYPFYDEHNLSNFIFAAVIWANNLWQSWTNDPKCDPTNTVSSTSDKTPDGGRLSIPSKIDKNRTKVLILVVNEPDRFESGELTYLGFNNDFSELPMAESDYIAFPNDSNNVEISGADGVIKFFGNCSEGKLKFLKKHLVRVIAKPQITWTINGNVSSIENSTKNTLYKGIVDGEQNRFLSINSKKLIYSTDCENWYEVATTETFDTEHVPVYSNDMWCILCQDEIKYSTDGAKTWGKAEKKAKNGASFRYIAPGNGKFMGIDVNGIVHISTDAKIWEKITNKNAPVLSEVIYLCYGNGRWFCMTNKSVLESTDDGQNWEIIYTHDFSDTRSACYSNGYLYFVTDNGDINKIYNGIAINMKSAQNAKNISSNLTFHDGKFFSLIGSSVITGKLSGNIKFSNLTKNSDGTDNEMTKSEGISITDQREFFIEPQQINGNSIDISLTNAQGMAEITNRPYSIQKKDNDTYPRWSGGQIYTNIKCPISVLIKPIGPIKKSITFSGFDENTGENDTKKLENDGENSIDKPTLFEFKGSTITGSEDNISFNESKNFKDNFENQKVKYSLNNVKIINIALKNQLIRDNETNRDPCIVPNSNREEGGFYRGGDGTTWTVYGIQFGSKLYKKSRTIQVSTENSDTTQQDQTAEEEQGNQEVSLPNSSSNSEEATWKELNENEFTIDEEGICTVRITDPNEAIYQICVANSGRKELINTDKLDDTMKKNNGIILSDNCICFPGDGTLLVTVAPMLDEGEISYTTPGDNQKTMIISEPQTLIIDPSNYRYDKGNDEYTIKFDTNNVTVVETKFVDGNDVGSYEEIRPPERSNLLTSKMIELSKFTDEVNIMSNLQNTNSLNYPAKGDFYLLLDDVDMVTQGLKLSTTESELTFSGLYKGFIPYVKNNKIEIELIGNSMQPTNRILLMSGFTLPVNEILYSANINLETAATQTASTDNSQNIQGTNDVDYTNSESVQRAIETVTTAACKKLKENFGDKLRVYLIKYKQQKSGSLDTDNSDTDDLAYLDSCADKIYSVTHDVSNKDQSESLESMLSEIAKDIKDLTNYKEARNITP